MSEPYWIPLTPSSGAQQIPPLVNGKWLAVKAGAMVWDNPAIADVTGLTAQLALYVPFTQGGVGNGYAQLDAQARVYDAQMPTRFGGGAAPPNNDLNQVVATGWYNNSGMANAPSANWFYVWVHYVNSDYQRQEAWDMISTNPTRYVRQKSQGTWGGWNNKGTT